MQHLKLQFAYQKPAFQKFPFKPDHLNQLANLIPVYLPVHCIGKILLHIVDNSTMQEILQTYYPFKKITDVLSFPHLNHLPNQDPDTIIGEVYLAFEQSQQQALQHQHSWLRESCYLVVHGILHLLGYDHQTTLDQAIMRYWEEFLITKKLAIARENY